MLLTYTLLQLKDINGSDGFRYLDFCFQNLKMELFVRTVNGWKPLIIFAKRFILDGWQGSNYTSANQSSRPIITENHLKRSIVNFVNSWYYNFTCKHPDHQCVIQLTHFRSIFSFCIPWKRQKTRGFSDVFRGYRQRTLAWNRLTIQKVSTFTFAFSKLR